MNSRRVLLFLLWVGAGFGGWYVSVFLFRTLISPVIPELLGSIPDGFMERTVIFISSHLAEWVLAFLLCMVLGVFTGLTFLRFLGFVIALVCVDAWYFISQYLAFTNMYEAVPRGTHMIYLQGFFSFFVLTPFIALVGGLAGHKMGAHSATPRKSKPRNTR
ncbi:MAG: hypothetical protein ACLFQR_02170 [Desulfovibrionales bacterium]